MIYPELEAVLLKFQDATLRFPFDNKTAVFKVAEKMFALVGLKLKPLAITLKCDPDDALFLRSQFEVITPGYHMNKDHWNIIILDGSMAPDLVRMLIENSYLLVVKSLGKNKKHHPGVFYVPR